MTSTPSPGARPRSLALLVAAGVLTVAVVALVLLFGVARPPTLAPLADELEPAPSASVAWIDRNGDEPCVHVAYPDATRAEVLCDLDLDDLTAWDAEGIHVRSWEVWEEVRVIDPTTGNEQRRATIDETDTAEGHRTAAVATRTVDGTMTVTLRSTGDVVWETPALENYSVRTGVVSPDGAWVALVDSADRLLLLPADGSREPRVWAEDVSVWDGLVWQGSTFGADQG